MRLFCRQYGWGNHSNQRIGFAVRLSVYLGLLAYGQYVAFAVDSQRSSPPPLMKAPYEKIMAGSMPAVLLAVWAHCAMRMTAWLGQKLYAGCSRVWHSQSAVPSAELSAPLMDEPVGASASVPALSSRRTAVVYSGLAVASTALLLSPLLTHEYAASPNDYLLSLEENASYVAYGFVVLAACVCMGVVFRYSREEDEREALQWSGSTASSQPIAPIEDVEQGLSQPKWKPENERVEVDALPEGSPVP